MRKLAVLFFALWATGALALDAPEYLGPKPPKKVTRVVTLAPSITEIVVALGAGRTLVGVSRFDDLPEVAKVPRVGGFVDPSIEAVLAAKPELLIVQPAPGNRRPVEKLAELGVPVLALPLHTVAQTLTAIRETGKVLGRRERAEALVRDIEAVRARIRNASKGKPKPKVLVVYEWEPLVVAGPGSFADELLKDAGAKNAAAKATTPYPVYSVEAVIAAAPEVILDVAHNRAPAEKLKTLPGFADARWVLAPNEDLMHPGPKLGAALEELYQLVHP